MKLVLCVEGVTFSTRMFVKNIKQYENLTSVFINGLSLWWQNRQNYEAFVQHIFKGYVRWIKKWFKNYEIGLLIKGLLNC